jgi:hypothetical protein
MEINHYGDVVMPALAMEDIVEGRIVLIASHSLSIDFGSQTDLPGARVPDTAADVAKAHYITKFQQDNRSLPIYEPQPSFDFALRYGFDQAENAPFSATVYITHPGVQLGRTIPSGSQLVLYGEGIYTLPSGAYVYNASLTVPGATIGAAYTDNDGLSDAGKVKYATSNILGEVVRYDSTTGNLTFRLYD